MLVAERQQYSHEYYRENQTTESQKKTSKPKKVNRVKPVLAILVCFAMVCFYFTLYARSIMASHQLSILNNQLEQEIKNTEYLKTQLIASYDMREIEDIAINQLGMQYPESYQIVYVDLPVEESDAEDTKVALVEKTDRDGKNVENIVKRFYNLFD